jgi:hypothetical protein
MVGPVVAALVGVVVTFLLTQWKLVLVGILLALLGVQTVRIDRAHRQYAELQTQYAEASRKAEADARATERKWQDHANETTKAKDEQLLNINARLDDALGELRNRSKRPVSDVPGTASTCKGATGAGIYAEDAAVVIREAARADRLRAALAACYSQYDALTK